MVFLVSQERILLNNLLLNNLKQLKTMENKYVTRQELANEFGLNVKALMKKLHKKNIFPDKARKIDNSISHLK
jgi:hypothetical protein